MRAGDKVRSGALKLINEYNKQILIRKYRSNVYIINEITESSLKLWFGVREFVKKRLQGTQLENLFNAKFERRESSYKKAQSEFFISEPTFYQKLFVITGC